MRRRIKWMLLFAGFLALTSSTLFAQERWIYRYNGSGNYVDDANVIAMGADGNLYAAGRSYGTGSMFDFTVVSLTDSGMERWVYLNRGSADGYDLANSIATDSDGNIYAAGRIEGRRTSGDFTVVSLTDLGLERWVYKYNGPGNGTDEARSIVVGSDGNLYVAGNSFGIGTSGDFTVVSLTTSGLERWVYRYNSAGAYYDVAYAVIMGTDGNLYAVGGGGIFADFTVVSLDTSGVERWVYRCDGSAGFGDEAISIAMGMDGHLYAAGYCEEESTYCDFAVISLTASGVERWVYLFDGGEHNTDAAYSITTGSDGNIYVAGMSWGTQTFWDFTVVSLTEAGVERWVYPYDAPGNGLDEAYSIIIGADANLYAVGQTAGSDGSEDFTVVSLTDSGGERWVYRYCGDGTDRAYSIVMGTNGNLYAAGFAAEGATNFGFTVVSLSDSGSVNAAVVGIDLPPHVVFVDSTYGVSAIVENLGTITVTSDVVATIDGYVDTVQVQNLRPGTSVQVDFQNWQVPSTDSTAYWMTVCIHAAGDIDTMNDCRQKTIFAYDPTGIQDEFDRPVATDFRLFQNSPNPFDRSTVISYFLPQCAQVTLSIYDITGRLVETLVNEIQQPGIHQVRWDRKNNPCGVYFYSLKACPERSGEPVEPRSRRAGEFVETRKMVVVE